MQSKPLQNMERSRVQLWPFGAFCAAIRFVRAVMIPYLDATLTQIQEVNTFLLSRKVTTLEYVCRRYGPVYPRPLFTHRNHRLS